MKVIQSGVKKNGKPQMFNFDNGSNYKCKQMELLAARLGSQLHYCKPYQPTGKAKVERWFLSMKKQWMSSLDLKTEIKTLDDLRTSLHQYVHRYNQTIHSSLDMSPIDRFYSESSLIKRIPEEKTDKIFLLEYERKVTADSIVHIENEQYEVDYRYAGQRLLLRYAPDLSRIYSVDKNTGELEEIKIVNKIQNSNMKRKKFKYQEETQ